MTFPSDTEAPRFRFATGDRPEAICDADVAVFDGAAVLFDVATTTVHRLDGFTAGVWMSCDGTRSVEQIAAELDDVFGLDAHDRDDDHSSRSRVDVALGALADHGLLVDFVAIAPPCIGCGRD